MAATRHVFDRGSWPEARRIAGYLRNETVGGIALLAGAVLAFVWANSPWREGYHALTEWHLGAGRFDLIYTSGLQPISARLRAVARDAAIGTRVVVMARLLGPAPPRWWSRRGIGRGERQPRRERMVLKPAEPPNPRAAQSRR